MKGKEEFYFDPESSSLPLSEFFSYDQRAWIIRDYICIHFYAGKTKTLNNENITATAFNNY